MSNNPKQVTAKKITANMASAASETFKGVLLLGIGAVGVAASVGMGWFDLMSGKSPLFAASVTLAGVGSVLPGLVYGARFLGRALKRFRSPHL